MPPPVWTLPILIHGHNIPGSYALLFFTASDFTSITSHIYTWVLFLPWLLLFFFLELFLYYPPVAYWAPTSLGCSSFSVISLCLSILFRGSQGKNVEVICPSLLQQITFCQNSPPWPIRLGSGLIASLSLTRLWSMWSVWLVFCVCGFYVRIFVDYKDICW